MTLSHATHPLPLGYEQATLSTSLNYDQTSQEPKTIKILQEGQDIKR